MHCFQGKTLFSCINSAGKITDFWKNIYPWVRYRKISCTGITLASLVTKAKKLSAKTITIDEVSSDYASTVYSVKLANE